jgi:hypothetical protein
MITISGLALMVISALAFWILLPRHGALHALVQKFDGGSSLTLVIMSAFTFGAVLLGVGILG